MVRRVKSRSLKRRNNKSHKEVVPVSYRRHNYCLSAGWSSLVARRAHNPKVAGSNPAPATKQGPVQQDRAAVVFGSASSDGPIAADRDSPHVATLPRVVMHSLVLDAAVVPHHQRAWLPRDAAGEALAHCMTE